MKGKKDVLEKNQPNKWKAEVNGDGSREDNY